LYCLHDFVRLSARSSLERSHDTKSYLSDGHNGGNAERDQATHVRKMRNLVEILPNHGDACEYNQEPHGHVALLPQRAQRAVGEEDGHHADANAHDHAHNCAVSALDELEDVETADGDSEQHE